MWLKPEHDQFVEELLLAGERVPPGVYRQVGTNRVVVYDHEDVLPASLDGRVACYVRVQSSWTLQQVRIPNRNEEGGMPGYPLHKKVS